MPFIRFANVRITTFVSVAVAAICISLSGCDRSDPATSSNPTATTRADRAPIQVASQAIARGDLAGADRALREHLITNPDDLRALELAGDVASGLKDHARAADFYQGVVDASKPSPSETVLSKLAVELMAAGGAYDCLNVLLQRAIQYPQNVEAHADSIGLAAMLGLAPQTLESMRWLMQHGHGDPELLQVLADPQRVEADADWCRELIEDTPADRRPEFGIAQVDAVKLDWEAVSERLSEVVTRHRDFQPAQILYGLSLVEQGHNEALIDWHQRLPARAKQSAGYWIVAGRWAKQQGKFEQSAHAFWKALSLDQASHQEALPQLLFALKQIGREEDAEVVSDLMVRRSNMRDRLKTHLEREGKSQRAALEVAKAMRDLGRIWEAEGWARLAASLPKQPVADLRTQYLAIRSELTAQTPWQSPERLISHRLDLSELPELQWQDSSTRRPTELPTSNGIVRFQQQASKRGLQHEIRLAQKSGQSGHAIYQSVGGGIGVIDFDLDGWPDLAIADLDGEPLQSNSSPNRLFRNLNGTYSDVSGIAGYQDQGFGQGICVGDYNDDGFPDLFDANIGRNRLYRNNGDGTFTDVTDEVGLKGQDWTTCGLIADIDGDGLADLYEVAYCAGREPYEKVCRNRKGIGSCVPLDFEAQPDRVWRGSGDGSFRDATAEWMTQSSPGRGLGIVAGQIDPQDGLDIYVANDMTVNHLWSLQREGEKTQLVDVGLLSGLGVSGQSRSQASMGIAAGDPDADGDLDLFLTHFSDDYNTYYEQATPGFWMDRSFQVGLAKPSMPLLGFGTEWADFDNNGTLELILTNGHVDDVDRPDVMYRMPPQLFQLNASRRWDEVDRTTLGDYFEQNHLGRALVTLDANNDGGIDVAITEIEGPVALLVNRSEQSGTFVNVEVTATGTQRDAIGTRLTARVNDRPVAMQLVAGDGYMCSNQRWMHIGTGDAQTLSDVVITWPSGVQESFGALQTGTSYRLVEGAGEAFAYEQTFPPTETR